MCRFKSCIILKDRVFVPDYDSHGKMLEELGIEDTFEHASNLFVRAEISPGDGDVFSDVSDWCYKVDQDILPDWYVPEIDEQRARKAVDGWMKAHTFAGGKHDVHDGIWYVKGSATVTATDSATVTAYGSATVKAYDSTTVKAYCSATVIIPPSSDAEIDNVTTFGHSVAIDHRANKIKAATDWEVCK